MNDIFAQRVLSAKLETLESEAPQQALRLLFRLGARSPKLARCANRDDRACSRSADAVWADGFDPIYHHGFDPLTPAPLPQGGEGGVDVEINLGILRSSRPLGGEGRG